MSDQFLCRSVYLEPGDTNVVECSFGDWTEILIPKEARNRANRLMLVAATAAVEANAASTMTSLLLTDKEEADADQAAAAFYGLLQSIRSGRGYEELDGMSPIFGAKTQAPLVSISWIPGRPLSFGLDEAQSIALNLFAAAEGAETDNWLQRSCFEAGVSNELLDRIFANFAKYRNQAND